MEMEEEDNVMSIQDMLDSSRRQLLDIRPCNALDMDYSPPICRVDLHRALQNTPYFDWEEADIPRRDPVVLAPPRGVWANEDNLAMANEMTRTILNYCWGRLVGVRV
jgi:hypothetical protein